MEHCRSTLLVPRQGFGVLHQISPLLLHIRALLVDDAFGALRILLDKLVNPGLHALTRWIFFVLASSHLAVDLTLDVPLDSFLFILTLPNILAHRFFPSRSTITDSVRTSLLVRVYRSPQQRLAHVHRVAVAVELC